MVLNNSNDCFKSILNDEYIDKSMFIAYTNSCLFAPASKFICVSRPHGFGKTYVAHMLTAYYSKGCDSHALFSNLAISKDETLEKYINKFNVITLDTKEMIALNQGVKGAVSFIQKTVCKELADAFCDISFSEDNLVEAIFNIYSKTGQSFIFVIDDYDFLFTKYPDEKEEISAYFNLLRGLFKGAIGDRAVALAYLTGLIPIGRYDSQTTLNNFDLISMLNTYRLGKLVGFTREEVSTLCQKHGIDFEKAKLWYDGYNLDDYDIYNPRSIMTLTKSGVFQSYWSDTASYYPVKDSISLNFSGLKEDIIDLVNGNSLKGVDITRFNNENSVFSSKDSVIVYLIHLGCLAYNSKLNEVYVPNEEVRRELLKSLDDCAWKEYIEVIKNSKNFLEKVFEKDCNYVALELEKVHEQRTSIISYNSEDSLKYTVLTAFAATCENYQKPLLEMPTGKGFADIVYLPKAEYSKSIPALIIELKFNKSASKALDQIKDRNYLEKVKDYSSTVMLLGISYDTKSKKHECVIENV